MDIYVLLFLFVICLSMICIVGWMYFVVKSFRYVHKQQNCHYDHSMIYFTYRIGKSPDEVYDKLARGVEREYIRYEYDSAKREIEFYWDRSMYGARTKYEVRTAVCEGENVLILYRLSRPSGRGYSHGLEERTERLERMNDFWNRLVNAEPIPYSKVYPDRKTFP